MAADRRPRQTPACRAGTPSGTLAFYRNRFSRYPKNFLNVNQTMSAAPSPSPATPALIDDHELMLTVTLPVRWGDMDAQGHVNNVQYFRFAEQARIEWFERHAPDRHGEGKGPVVAQTSCRYIRSVVYPATLEILVYCAVPGRSSFRHRYVMRDAKDPARVYAEGDAVMVWIDHQTQKSTPIPDRVRDRLPKARG
jgi:acyl-CoA thioester hydrolase